MMSHVGALYKMHMCTFMEIAGEVDYARRGDIHNRGVYHITKKANFITIRPSLVKNSLHIIFSTMNLKPQIQLPVEYELQSYLGGICNNLDCQVIKVGG